MGYAQLTEISACFVLSMCFVTVMLFCCKRPKTGPFCEPGSIVRSRKSRTPHKTLENSEVHLCASPHPFLPPSLHEVASATGPTRVDHIDSTRHNASSAAPEPVVLLMRQESASHRDCELPPVPPSGEIKQQSRYSICDDLPSESDGLYASVGHSGNVRSGLQCEERSINAAAAAASSGQLICAGQRDSVADSANAPYYSSVASVLAPNYYGELPEPGSLQPYNSSTPLGSSQHENLYARVRPCVGRSGHSQPQTSVETPCLTDTGDALSSPSHASDSPPLPERAYGQSAIELVDHTRASNLHFLPTSVSSTSSAYPASPQLGNSSTLTSTQPNFSTSRSTALSSHNVPTDYKESHYGKISVRESLASLRARKAMPHLGPPFPRVPAAGHDLSANAASEYERVSSSASDTNTSVYDFLPQTSASKEAAPDAPHILCPINKETRFDQLVDAYAETPCVSSKPESQVASLRSPNYPNHRPQDFSAVFVNSFVRTQEPSVQPEITFSHILTEMRAFRHVDSEVDIVYALSSDPGARALYQTGRNCETPQVNTRAQSVPNADNFPTPTFPCATSSAVPKPCSLNLQVPVRNHPRLMTPVMERSGESGSILFSAQTPGSSPSPIQIDQCFTGRVIPSPHFDIPTTRQSPSRTQVPFEFLRKSNCHISDTSTYDDVAFV